MPIQFLPTLLYFNCLSTLCLAPVDSKANRPTLLLELPNQKVGDHRQISLLPLHNNQPRFIIPVNGPQVTGKVYLSLSTRVAATGKPRFVLTGGRLEKGEHESEPGLFELPSEIGDYFDKQASARIRLIDELCNLADKQKEKLKLAAKGDLSRIAREARLVNEQFAELSPNNALEVRGAAEAVEYLNELLDTGLLRENSMFCLIVQSTLSSEQQVALITGQFRRQLQDWKLNLTDDQSKTLVALLHQHSRHVVNAPLIWESQHCLPLLHKLEKSELQKLLDEQQLERVRRLCELPFELKF